MKATQVTCALSNLGLLRWCQSCLPVMKHVLSLGHGVLIFAW